MAYQISYGQDCVKKKNKREFRIPKPSRGNLIRIGMAVFILLLAFACMIPQVRLAVRDMLLPGEPAITEAALERLVEAISDGEAIQTALTDFCREVINGGLQAA